MVQRGAERRALQEYLARQRGQAGRRPRARDGPLLFAQAARRLQLFAEPQYTALYYIMKMTGGPSDNFYTP